MRTTSLPLASLLLGAFLAACGGKVGNGPCEGATPDPACNQSCLDGEACPPGFYCADDGTCNAECVAGGAGCGDNEYCDTDGVCQPIVDADCPNVTLTGERTTPV